MTNMVSFLKVMSDFFLTSDGFNPFNNLSKSYSIWLVLFVPYNLSPWSCMKDPYLMMSLLILGPKALKNNVDIFLCLLVDKLRELYENRIYTHDTYNSQIFMHEIFVWTINNFSTYVNLFVRSTKGKICKGQYDISCM